MNSLDKFYDIIIIGCGISGATLAERYADIGKKVLIIEKRSHIAGNCYDYIDENGILTGLYGAHLFHTSDDSVWKYINKFSEWIPYEHKVKACIEVDGKMEIVPVPVNIETVNVSFKEGLKNEKDMIQWLKNNTVVTPFPKNSKESCITRYERILYNLIFRDYTKKQWDKYPEELDSSILERIPVRTSFNDRYFCTNMKHYLKMDILNLLGVC